MKHLAWSKSARVFEHSDEGKPNTFTWKSSVGQANVDLGSGKFAPYVWSTVSKVIKFGDCELRFTASGLEFWHETEKLNTLSFNPEYKQSTTWKRRTLIPGSLSIEEIDNGNSKVELKISYKIVTVDSETEIFVRVGYNHKVHFGTKFKSLKNGVEQRISLEFAEKFDAVEERDLHGTVLPTARLKTAKAWIAIDRSELSDHEFEQGTGTKVHIGRKVYALNEEKIVSPTTWGTDIGIAANANDGYDQYPDGSYSSVTTLLYTGAQDATNHYDANFRWTGLAGGTYPIAQGDTIDSAIIDLYLSDNYANTTKISAWDVDDAPVCDSTHRPGNASQCPLTGATPVTFAPSGTGWKSATITTIVQEIITSYATDSINILAIGSVGPGIAYYEIQAYDNAGTYEAELTITFTAGAPPAGRTTKNVRTFPKGIRTGISRFISSTN